MKAARPLYETTPTRGAKTWLPAIQAEAKRLGTPLMPWQNKAARLIAELAPGGAPRWEMVIVTVPRQQGKTALAGSVITARAKSEPDLRMYGTAQTRVDASHHLENLGLALAGTVKTRLGVGNERIEWANGSRFEIISPTASGGHGASIDFVLLDEVWALLPHVMAGIIPARAARPHSQLLALSTMGTPESEVWNQLVARGRESVDDPDSKIAYLEYAAPDDAAVFDESRWSEWMPALGRTVSVASVRAARDTLPGNEFIRAFGNRITAVVNVVFPDEWVQDSWAVITPAEDIVLSVEVNDTPAGATICAGHTLTDGSTAVRVLEWRYGSPQWVPAAVAHIAQQRNVEAVVADFGGPARAVQAELTAVCEGANVALIDRRPRDQGADTGQFYDALREGSVKLERSEPLEQAITGAHRKDLGDLWVISRRRMAVDASPLIAAIMAFGVVRELVHTPRVAAFVL